MKRDMDLIRQILFAIEESPTPEVRVSIKIEGRSQEEVSYRIKLLAEARLIEALDMSTLGKFEWQARTLTWEGHEFLDAARDDTRWNKAKGIIVEKAGTLTFDLLKQVVSDLVRKAVFPSP